jgi:hypothetical protein
MIKPEARLKLIDGSACRTTHSLKNHCNAGPRTEPSLLLIFISSKNEPEPNCQDIYYF